MRLVDKNCAKADGDEGGDRLPVYSTPLTVSAERLCQTVHPVSPPPRFLAKLIYLV